MVLRSGIARESQWELAGVEELAGAEDIGGVEDIAGAVAIGSVGINILTISIL